MGRKIGYVRVSTTGQCTARQDVLMEQLGVDEVFTDRLSGKSTDRPQLTAMMEQLQSGDTVIVESISRFARNTKDLLILVDQLTEKGADFASKKEGFDTNTPAGRLMLTMFGAIAELERAYILDRQREGMEIKKAEGAYSGENHKGRTRQTVDSIKFEELYQLYTSGFTTQKQAAVELSISKENMSRRFAERSEVGEMYDPNLALALQKTTA